MKSWYIIKEEPIMIVFPVSMLIVLAVPLILLFKIEPMNKKPDFPIRENLKKDNFNPTDMTDPRAQYLYHKFIKTMIWEK